MTLRRDVTCPRCHGAATIEEIDGPAMRAARKRKGLSLRALAERLDLSAMYVCDVENGRRKATVEVMREIERLLK